MNVEYADGETIETYGLFFSEREFTTSVFLFLFFPQLSKERMVILVSIVGEIIFGSLLIRNTKAGLDSICYVLIVSFLLKVKTNTRMFFRDSK